MADRKYLVYKINNRFDGKIYVGVHSTFNKNDRYMGSGVEIKEALKEYGRKSFVKEILFEFDTKEEMLAKEKEIVTKDFCIREDTYNRIEGGGTYQNVGMIAVKDIEGKCFLVYRDDPRWLFGEVVGVMKGKSSGKGKTMVKDQYDNYYRVDVNDPRYLSGELVSLSKGRKGIHGFEGKKHLNETKEKQSAKASLLIGDKNSSFGTCWITKENENKKIKKENLEVYLQQGWIKGRKLK